MVTSGEIVKPSDRDFAFAVGEMKRSASSVEGNFEVTGENGPTWSTLVSSSSSACEHCKSARRTMVAIDANLSDRDIFGI